MLAARLLALALTSVPVTLISAAPLPVVSQDGQAHVAASALEREAGIVIKRLPGSGRNEFVACRADLCAPLKGVLTDGENLLAPVASLSDALNLTANFDDSRRHFTFSPARRESPSTASPARVGSLAPNLRLTKLDGSTVTLAELRGQRVLINSWASW
jgi:hypothetical protein